jgi:superoxide dismutase, Fe-Mn family
MTISLMNLPYKPDALEPHMSAETVDFHYGKHHRKYVDTLNGMLAGHRFAELSLEEIILAAASDPEEQKIFNNAAQVWNHDFFWNSVSPNGGGEPAEGELRSQIERAFGSFSGFRKAFLDCALGQFGSGWAWLVVDKGQLEIISTSNAMPPFVQGKTALLACDVWEHAYYVDYRNDRGQFVETFLDKLADWTFADKALKEAA